MMLPYSDMPALPAGWTDVSDSSPCYASATGVRVWIGAPPPATLVSPPRRGGRKRSGPQGKKRRKRLRLNSKPLVHSQVLKYRTFLMFIKIYTIKLGNKH